MTPGVWISAARSRPARWILLAIALTIAVLISLTAWRSPVRATSGGDPYSVPLVTDTNPDPNIVETTLRAQEANVDIGNGVTAHAVTFNGQIPGPTFQLKVGDTVIVHFENHLSKPTSIHWHGIELANEVDGTPFTQNQVEPNGSFLYKFKANRPGEYWYHPHHHSSTNQVFKGLYGMIIVMDPSEAALQANGTLPPASQTKPIVLSDTTVCKDPGTNDTHAYNDTVAPPAGTAPWAGGAANTLPPQPLPSPKNLCEGPAVVGPVTNPYPINEEGIVRGAFSAGDIPNIQTFLHAGRTNEGQTVLTNGKNVGARGGGPIADGYVPAVAPSAGASELNVQPGQGLRLEILNASTVRYMRLQLTTSGGALVPLRRVGGEGGLLNNAITEGGTQGGWVTKYTSGEILLPPGTRADVVAAIPSAPTTGVMTLWTRDYSRTGPPGFSDIPTVPVMHLNLTGPAVSPAYTIPNNTSLRAATGNPVQALGAANANLLDPNNFAPAKDGIVSQNITLTQVVNTELGVNGTFGTHEVAGDYMDADHLGSSRYAKPGDTLQLTVQNTTGANHPFHLHGFSIQPIKLDGPGANDDFNWNYNELRDNVDVPGNYTLTFRVKLDPRPLVDGITPGGELGRWLFHCHIFFHATNGMLGELVVGAPNGNERPNVNVNGSSVSVSQGQTATITGNYKDRDGDPVSLKASVGTVKDNGGGKWTWTYPTGADGSRIVYITGTDTQGLKGQIAFSLTIPAVKALSVSPKTFAVLKSGPAETPAAARKKRHKKGTTFGYTLSEASRVVFTIEKKSKAKGRKVKGKCRKATRRNRKKPKCSLYKRVGRFAQQGVRGKNTKKFSGKIGRKRLKAGSYRASLVATTPSGKVSQPTRVSFKVASR